jgi:hypothetical protein
MTIRGASVGRALVDGDLHPASAKGNRRIMPNATKRLLASLQQMRVPDLQRRFAEATGEATRSPNKVFLIRRIIEATEVASRAVPEAQESRHSDEQPIADEVGAPGLQSGVAEDGSESAVPAAEALDEPSLPEPARSLEEVPTSGDIERSGDLALSTRLGTPDEPQCAPVELLDVAGDELRDVPSEPHDAAQPSEAEASPVEAAVNSSHDGGEARPERLVAAMTASDAANSQVDAGERDQSAAASESAPADDASQQPVQVADDPSPGREGPAEGVDGANTAASAQLPRGALKGLTIEELQAKYLEVVGRPTGSTNRAYLEWKIREAAKGKIPTGPRSHGRRTSQGDDVMVLPLRLPATTVDAMDHAWHSRGIRTRMDFLREAIRQHLERLGATEAASLFVRGEADAAEEAL